MSLPPTLHRALKKAVTRPAMFLGCILVSACSPSEHALAKLASQGLTQASAPVKATSTIIVDAPKEQVWSILVDVSRWPTWQPGVKTVSGAGTLHNGESFTWQTDGTTIRSKVELLQPPDRVAWIGRAATAHAIHCFTLTALGPNKTKVESAESMDGFLLSWFYSSADLQKAEDTLLSHLAAAAATK